MQLLYGRIGYCSSLRITLPVEDMCRSFGAHRPLLNTKKTDVTARANKKNFVEWDRRIGMRGREQQNVI
jgi:hypothetical protein